MNFSKILLVLLALVAGAPFRNALAATAPTLGTAQSFAVIGGSTVTNTGPTILTGDLGVSPGTAITGFPPGIVVGGTIHAADAVAAQAQADALAAYNALASQACNTTYGVPTDIGGLTLVPGVYCFASSAQLTGTLTLDAQGDSAAVWVFKIGSTLVTASNATVLLVNGAQQCNVFWQVGSSATIGTGTRFVGNILARTSITLNANANVAGRALALGGAVTMDSNNVAVSSCALPALRPTISKVFNPPIIDAGGISEITLTLSNSSGTTATLTAPFIDSMPAGVTIAGTPSTTCGGTVTSTATSVTLTGGSIAAGGSCTIMVAVTAANGGAYINALPAGALQTSNGSNAVPAAATLTVRPPAAVTLGKAFSPAIIPAGGASTLTITLSNGNSTAATLTAPLTDTLPAGVTVTGGASTTCGGTVTSTASSFTLTGGSIPANGTCTVTIAVTAASGGAYVNGLPAGALQTNKGNNAAPALATLTVGAPSEVTLAKAFSPEVINAGGASTLTITLLNTNSTVATLTAPLTDTLPGGVNTSGSGSTTCGGTVTNTTTSVTLTGGAVPANGSCTVTIGVTAANGGNFINRLAPGALQTSLGNNGSAALATLTVIPPSTVTLSKSFDPVVIHAGETSLITLILSNSGDTIANLIQPLVDVLPSGLTITGSFPTTCGGTITFTDHTFTLTGGSIPANGTCTIGSGVPVTAPVPGVYFNSVRAGALQTSNGSNAAPAVATLTVLPGVIAPTLSNSFTPALIAPGGTSTLTLTLRNSNNTPARLTAALTDTLPNEIKPSGNSSTTCGGTVKVNGFKLSLNGGAIPANGSCTVTAGVSGRRTGSYQNLIPAGALRTDKGNSANPASATLTVN